MNSIHHCDFCVTLRFSLMTFRILQFAIHALQYALAVSMRSRAHTTITYYADTAHRPQTMRW